MYLKSGIRRTTWFSQNFKGDFSYLFIFNIFSNVRFTKFAIFQKDKRASNHPNTEQIWYSILSIVVQTVNSNLWMIIQMECHLLKFTMINFYFFYKLPLLDFRKDRSPYKFNYYTEAVDISYYENAIFNCLRQFC